jgi:hypothetical protein
MPLRGFPVATSFINFYDGVYWSYMDTNHVEFINASPTPTSIPIIPAKDVRDIRSSQRPKALFNPASSPKWGWQDALYLFILLLLVVAMARYFTPDLTGEVAGMWWDPLLNMWTLSWDTTTLLHAPTHLWQAQLLYPNNLTLSYSENLLGEAIFFAPFFLATHNPVLAYNVTFYLTFLLCGINMYIVARHYTGKSLAAFVAALIYAFSPYRIGQIDHIHVIAGEWIPLAFLYLDLSFQNGRWRHWSLFALFYFLQVLSSIYYGIFLSYTLLAFILIRYTRPFLSQLLQKGRVYLRYLLKQALKPTVVFTITFIILGLLLAPYFATQHSGLARTLSETAAFSAFVRDFGFTAPFNWLYGIHFYNGVPFRNDSEHYLFLGWAALVLAALGVFLAFRQRNATMRALALTGLIVVLFSFGPALQYAGPQGAPILPGPAPSLHHPTPLPYPPAIPMPWQLTYYVLPGFKALRAPARLIGVFLLVLALLAAYAAAWLQEISQKALQPTQIDSPQVQGKVSSHRPASSSWRAVLVQVLLIGVSCAIVLEAIPVQLPITYVPTGNHIPAVYQWLGAHADQQAIVELPISQTDGKGDAWYDYYAIYHTHPLVNGWSGFRPPLTEQIAGSLLSFPSPGSLATLKRFHIRYVVLHLQLFSPAVAATLLAKVEASPGLFPVADFGSDSVWQVR